MEEAKSVVATHPHPNSPDEPPGNVIAGLAASVIDRARDTGAAALSAAKDVVT